MPSKILRPFQRRKSSSNVLEEVQNPPETSFRVFERPSGAGKSFGGGHILKIPTDNRPAAPRKNSLDGSDGQYQRPGPDGINRVSGATETSLSTAGANGSAGSSFRHSFSSTNASSVDTYSDKNTPIQRPFKDIPVPPPTSARGSFPVKNGLRISSFGLRGRGNSAASSPQPPAHTESNQFSRDGRDRTVSTSTASTATPPKLFDSDLALGGSELDNFTKMFDNIAYRNSREPSPIRGQPAHGQPPSAAPGNYGRLSKAYPRIGGPTPLKLNNTTEIDSSPFSWHSEDSGDRLMRSPSPSNIATQTSSYYTQQQHLPPSRQSPIPRIVTPETRLDRESQRTGPVRRNMPPSSFPQSFAPGQPATGYKSQAEATEPSRQNISPQGRLSFEADPALADSVDLATQYEEIKPPPPKPVNPNKVMTPAQFERYREQQEQDRRMFGRGGDSDSDGDDDRYEDEDEIEKARKATLQRRKQEAQLAVYRQSMMKVTGEQPGSRPSSQLSLSDSRLTLEPKKSGPSSADEDEDEDVPLGILAAHGFPNKNRPPTRLSKSPSNSNLNIPGAHGGSGESARPGNLPVFARNLPQDPYFGAGLVNPSNRESLAMSGGSSVYAVPPGPAQGPYLVHPSGLVGVIAGEERARAMRRGSPNPQGNYDMPPHPGMARSQTMGNVQYPGMMPPGMLTPGDQAQIQMSQQMAQMMQMQMQWMQQMQQMVQMQGGPMPPGMVPEMMGPPMPGPRAQSTPLPEFPGQRSMSITSAGQWNRSSSYLPTMNIVGPSPTYAPSLAPSERSNVGLASRYRPVSMAPDGHAPLSNRSSTFTSSTARPWTSYNTGRRSPTGATIRTVNPPPAKKKPAVEDDDDEEGWAEMKAKRDKKQRGWKLRKAQTSGAEGLKDLVSGL